MIALCLASYAMTVGGGLRITGTNLQITEPLRAHAAAKLQKPLEAFSGVLNDATGVELHMKVEHRGGGLHDSEHVGQEAHIAELTCRLKGKHEVIRATSESDNMYASVDQLTATLSRKLRKFKERKYNKRTREATTDSFVDEIDEAEEEEAAGEAEATLAALEVMRSKKFSMPAIDVDEAAVELDLLDHPFYVFKNKGTGQINVVYKRNGGGVGLIEPEE